MMNQNYNLNNETIGYEGNKNNVIDNIEINIPNYSTKMEEVQVDLSKYRNNKPTREIVRGRLLDE